ncbi:MAG: 50S ribosomal protein L27 [Candidatus Harrisonbacteria bacterium RIFCSPHIGHO2_12_FULL_48_16]|uniref:Large ribosomal subunit protein bL27 n=3 Tax=Parcubacteria group TaxID=1794811 RepID=A0A1G2FWZ7_9BACT|nr:MAG: 50S ribosomal protein L27 [Candidatus Harrisonbacteria bacterium RIFCSPHIGHO2_12_FULL_48_16]OGZ42604.1 MAG: 50S ribosomal protein L27 [Candidatus Ryanbacteria bacterium RIFCSPHIGHO2_01_45_13]
MAHTKSGGSTKLGRDSAGKRLGVKINDNEAAKVGEIIVRQRGAHYIAGQNVANAGDDTLYALKSGTVKFVSGSKTGFDNSKRRTKIVKVI